MGHDAVARWEGRRVMAEGYTYVEEKIESALGIISSTTRCPHASLGQEASSGRSHHTPS